ncbi:MAG: single-stranded DNA-binding protein [Phycisphaerae bacterium]
MANLNKVMLIGNLTRDPEVTFAPSNQTAICKLGIAVNRSWTGQDGQKKEETTFVDCTAFGKTGEVIGKYLKKGRPIFIEGRLKLDQWEAQDGGKRSKLHVIIESFQFIDSKPAGSGGGGGGGEPDAGEAGGYAPRAQAPRPAARPVGRPMPAAPSPEMDPPAPDDDGPPAIREDDIPF